MNSFENLGRDKDGAAGCLATYVLLCILLL